MKDLTCKCGGRSFSICTSTIGNVKGIKVLTCIDCDNQVNVFVLFDKNNGLDWVEKIDFV